MRWNDGDIDLDADESDPDDLDAGHIVFDDGDSTAFDSEWEKSLLSEWVERLKDRDVSFRVPVLDLSNCDQIEVTAVAWLKSPRMMLETLAARLNEVIERCNLLPVHGLVLELKRECYSYPGLSDLYNLSCTLHICGSTVDYVNSIQPTPLKGEVLVQLGKSVLPGRTQELNRCINCCKRELTKLAKWIKIKDIQNANEPSVDPRRFELIPPPLASNQTQSAETNVSPEVPPFADNTAGSFEVQNEFIRIRGFGEDVLLERTAGVDRLIAIVTSRERRISVWDLVKIGAKQEKTGVGRVDCESDGLVEHETLDDEADESVLGADANSAVKNAVRELIGQKKAAHANGHLMEAKRLKEQIDATLEPFKKNLKVAATTVSNSLNRTYQRLRKDKRQSLLAGHFERYVKRLKKESDFVYVPDEHAGKIHWK
jgi:hypothetical protein